jgi:hypothetical protein
VHRSTGISPSTCLMGRSSLWFRQELQWGEVARQLKGNPSIITRPDQGVRKFVPGRTKCSLCGEVMHRHDSPRPGAGRLWRHGDGCPPDTEYAMRLRAEKVNTVAPGLAASLVSGSDELWEELALSVELEPAGVLASSVTVAVRDSPDAPGAVYLRKRLPGFSW